MANIFSRVFSLIRNRGRVEIAGKIAFPEEHDCYDFVETLNLITVEWEKTTRNPFETIKRYISISEMEDDDVSFAIPTYQWIHKFNVFFHEYLEYFQLKHAHKQNQLDNFGLMYFVLARKCWAITANGDEEFPENITVGYAKHGNSVKNFALVTGLKKGVNSTDLIFINPVTVSFVPVPNNVRFLQI